MVKQRRVPKDSPKGDRQSPSKPTKTKILSKKKTDNKLAVFISFNIILVVGLACYIFYQYYIENIVISPYPAPPIVGFLDSKTPQRKWGSYRPGVYFGLKQRVPQSIVTGLMWFPQKIVNNDLSLRHWCNQNDKLKTYGWLQHDGVNFGIQDIEDEDFVISTSFVKRPLDDKGGDWTARISAKPKMNNDSIITPMSLLFYIATEEKGTINPKVVDGSQLTHVQGEVDDIGQFTMTLNPINVEGGGIIKFNFLNTVAPPGLNMLKETVMQHLSVFRSKKKGEAMQVFGLNGNVFPAELKDRKPNFIVHQVTFFPPLELEVIFESAASGAIRPNRLAGDIYSLELDAHISRFDDKFESIFHISSNRFSADEIIFAKSVLSNMIGGLGYFHGSSLVKSIHNKEPLEYGPSSLFTAVPSRSFFPRGFLWDEGFHNLLISQWDAETAKDILAQWLNLLNAEGWIPREQILSIEARARVPKEFIVQYNTNANPPTLFLAYENLLNMMQDRKIPLDLTFLKSSFPRLKAWFKWFNFTQIGKIPGTYRWRGRNAKTDRELNPKTLTSGLDDYPRASHPTDDERHVDLWCWMALGARVLRDVADIIGEPCEIYATMYQYLSNNHILESYHWSKETQTFSDYGLHTESVKLIQPRAQSPQPGVQPPKLEKIRQVNDDPKLQYVNHYGYISLFPFLLNIIRPENPKLGKILKDLNDPNLLWTNYGLLSLSKKSSLYMKYNTEHDPPYWRGPIWININFLAIRALHVYSQMPGPYQNTAFDIYKQLRQNVLNNMVKEYKRTGYVWEQYNDKTGNGQGSHPFTGWSSLALLAMSEIYN